MSLAHLIREPADEAQGALILNHGRGADERDLHDLLDAIDPERRLLGLTPGAPITDIRPGGRHWYIVERVGYPHAETFHESYRLLTDFLDETLEEAGIGWERTVIGGFSMGAVMSYAVALGEDRPSPAAIIAMSGFIPAVQGWEPHVEGREGLPVLIHHGSSDPVIGVHFGRQAGELLTEAGLDVTYLESEAGHWVPPELVPRMRELVARVTGAGGD